MNPELDVYIKDFEEPFLKSTKEYYHVEGATWLHSDSVPEYLSRVEAALAEEEMRVSWYLNSATDQKLQVRVTTSTFRPHFVHISSAFRPHFVHLYTMALLSPLRLTLLTQTSFPMTPTPSDARSGLITAHLCGDAAVRAADGVGGAA